MRRRLAVALISAIALGAVLWVQPDPQERASDQVFARFAGGYVWSRPEEWFGGFSGLEMSGDGQSFSAITDRGYIVRGQIDRAEGQVADISVDSANSLHNDVGTPATGNLTDSEGIAIDQDGRIYVSFEYVQRIWVYDSHDTRAQWASYTKSWRALKNNGGLEMLAIDGNGTLFTVPEYREGNATDARVFRWSRGGKWQQPFTLPLRGRFLPVGGDFGPDGKLYLLERAVTPFGFRSRVRRFDVAEDGVSNEVVLFTSWPGKHDNLEGIAVWQDQEGRIRLSLISDDNFMWFQRTELADYVVEE